jgi:glycosyltransferase involved in cell wall biosynthesis
MTPLRVAFFNYSDQASGAEALIDQTITSLIPRGVEARLYVMDRFTDRPYVNAIPRFPGERRLEYMFRRATGRNNFLFPSTLFLDRRSWLKDADIWHFHNLHGHFASIPVLSKLSWKKPIVLSPVDQFLATGYCTYSLGCERFREACGECPQLDLPYPGLSRDTTSQLLAMKRNAVTNSRFNLLVHTKFLRDFYASTFVGKRPIEQIYYGVDTKQFRPMAREEVLKDLDLPPTTALTLGILHSDITDRRKGLLPLIESLQSLAEKMPGRLRLLVIGASSERAKQFATSSLTIATLPFLRDNETLAKALNACDVLLYPTRADNLSLTCLDALACGVPVISSRVGGQPEAIFDNVNGFLCEPDRLDQFAERVAQLASDDHLRKRLAAEARRLAVAEFDIEIYISNLIAYYYRILELPDR